MAKELYRIPFSINIRRFEAPYKPQIGELSLTSKSYKLYIVIFAILLLFLVPVVAFLNPFFWGFGLMSMILMFIGWEWFWLLVLLPQENGEDGYKWIRPVVKYWISKKERFIETKGDAELVPVQDLLQIKEIRDDGRILFTDGWMGYMFSIDGYASYLLFDEEREKVLDAFERYLRTSPPNVSIAIPMDFSPLELTAQKHHAQRVAERQTKADLRGLAHHRYSCVADQLESTFKALSQFILLTAATEELLIERSRALLDTVNADMAKSIEICDSDEVLRNFSSIYQV